MKKNNFKLFDSTVKIGKKKIPVSLLPVVCGIVAVYLVFIGVVLVLIATIISLLTRPLL
jgi:hypothetical protein